MKKIPESIEKRPTRQTYRADAIVSTCSIKATLSEAPLVKADSSPPSKSFSGVKTEVVEVIRNVKLHTQAKVICSHRS